MSPEETTEFQQAVDRARARLEDLAPLMEMANTLDQQAGDVILDSDEGFKAS